MSNQMLLSECSLSETQSSIYNNSEYSTPSLPHPQSRILEAMKTQYRLDQQVKFLSLQAETESLLQQLQALKQQRAAVELPGLEDSGHSDRTAN
jgi:hypothetical protein